MRCENISIKMKIPVPIDKPDGNFVQYSSDAVAKACEQASGVPLITYNENGESVVIGVANHVRWSNDGFIEVDGMLKNGGSSEIVNEWKDCVVSSMEIQSFGICE